MFAATDRREAVDVSAGFLTRQGPIGDKSLPLAETPFEMLIADSQRTLGLRTMRCAMVHEGLDLPREDII